MVTGRRSGYGELRRGSAMRNSGFSLSRCCHAYCVADASYTVKAKQSTELQGSLDCFVASLLAMTAEAHVGYGWFCEPIQSDLAGPVPTAKTFPFSSTPNQWFLRSRSAVRKRALRDRHERWVRNAMDAAARETNAAARVRRSRVVLTPRRWRQVGEDACRVLLMTVATKPGHREKHEGNR
jgi:hypothetical protein